MQVMDLQSDLPSGRDDAELQPAASETKPTAWILLVDGPVWSQIYMLSPDHLTRIGRAPDNEIVLSDSRCSRHHCDIVYHQEQWIVRDRRSRNGTYLCDAKVTEPRVLQEGDTLQIGPHRLVFTTDTGRLYGEDGSDSNDTEDNIVALSESVSVIAPKKSQQPKWAQKAYYPATNSLIGESPSLEQLRKQVRRVGQTDATVLVRGESGVGKELVARSLHEYSRRRTAPFICLNCAALSESLLESELFGHERGAFTGATDRKLGKFELAHTGTLFLDEVGELSLPIQAKFLRVLEGQPFHRIGGNEAIRADVRVIAATNRDLEEAVRAQGFREDLYYRLHVMQIMVDPLREHSEDIPLLAQHFFEEAIRQTKRPVKSITEAAIARLLGYRWPGNIRELKNAIHRAVILCAGEHIEPQDIYFCALDDEDTSSYHGARSTQLDGQSLVEVEVSHILTVLEQTGWNKTKAAEILGIERSTLDRKMKRHDLRRPPGDRTQQEVL
jgi:transcriptional regulator with PAS, ATPase and Fis domain